MLGVLLAGDQAFNRQQLHAGIFLAGGAFVKARARGVGNHAASPKIAQPFKAGNTARKQFKVPSGTAEHLVAIRKDLSSLTGLVWLVGRFTQP
jgi:hypothetical protein